MHSGVWSQAHHYDHAFFPWVFSSYANGKQLVYLTLCDHWPWSSFGMILSPSLVFTTCTGSSLISWRSNALHIWIFSSQAALSTAVTWSSWHLCFPRVCLFNLNLFTSLFLGCILEILLRKYSWPNLGLTLFVAFPGDQELGNHCIVHYSCPVSGRIKSHPCYSILGEVHVSLLTD